MGYKQDQSKKSFKRAFSHEENKRKSEGVQTPLEATTLKIDAKEIKPPCPYFERCGGCQLQQYAYEDTLKYKQQVVDKLLGSFGKIKPIIGMENPWSYRNKSHHTYKLNKRGHIESGMYEAYSHRLTPIERCLIQDERADAIAMSIQKLLRGFKIRPYDEDDQSGLFRHVLIKIGKQTDEVMVVLIVSRPVFPSKNNFVKELIKLHPEIKTVIMNINAGKTSMILGRQEQVVYGSGYIEDVLMGKRFQISAKSFYQINPTQTEVLYGAAIEMATLTGREKIMDAYSGIGTIGLIASDLANEVIGVELNKEAVRDAIKNAKLNRIKNARFYEGDAGQFMRTMAKEKEFLDVVFMDPPRSGSDEAFLGAVLELKPKQVVYVSCNPVTQARDLKILLRGGYKVKEIQPVDMFPWTGHVECCVLLYHKDYKVGEKGKKVTVEVGINK